jgi:hypothetical protein
VEDYIGDQVDDSLRKFMEYLLFRQTDSLTHMNYKKFFEIFEEGYLLEESPYEQDMDQSRESLK